MLVLIVVTNAAEYSKKQKHQQIVDSLKKREAKLPTKPDPVSYLDDATAGTFKPNTPPKGLDQPLDEHKTLVLGYRILVYQTNDETDAKKWFNKFIHMYQTKVSLRFENDSYSILLGNFQDSIQAQQFLKQNKEIHSYHPKIIPSRILKNESTRKQNPIPIGEKIRWTIQVAVLSDYQKAQEFRNQLDNQLPFPVFIKTQSAHKWTIHVGEFSNLQEAENATQKLKNLGYQQLWIKQSKEEL
ncbi:MAG: SPOR domain-containing protein [bacterium]|nr:SPOR domain-containing protein [bacterium]